MSRHYSLEKVVGMLQAMDPTVGLPIAQTLLIVARHHPEGITQIDIARILGKHRQNVTRWLDRLGDEPIQHTTRVIRNLNLIHRGTGIDGRTNAVLLTKYGEQMLNALKG